MNQKEACKLAHKLKGKLTNEVAVYVEERNLSKGLWRVVVKTVSGALHAPDLSILLRHSKKLSYYLTSYKEEIEFNIF